MLKLRSENDLCSRISTRHATMKLLVFCCFLSASITDLGCIQDCLQRQMDTIEICQTMNNKSDKNVTILEDFVDLTTAIARAFQTVSGA